MTNRLIDYVPAVYFEGLGFLSVIIGLAFDFTPMYVAGIVAFNMSSLYLWAMIDDRVDGIEKA